MRSINRDDLAAHRPRLIGRADQRRRAEAFPPHPDLAPEVLADDTLALAEQLQAVATGQPLGLLDEVMIDEQRVVIPPGGSLLIYTDGVAHAAASGQYAIEQTLIIPPAALVAPELAPYRILEKLAGRSLVS